MEEVEKALLSSESFMRFLVSAALALLVSLMSPLGALAADADHGAQIFSGYCAACHMGGGNVVNGQRTLQ